MKNYFLYTAVFALCFSNLLADQKIPTKTDIHIVNLDASGTIQYLIEKTRFPICFELQALDLQTQAITATQLIKTLQEKEKKDLLSLDEQARLKNITEVAKEHPDSIVDWNIPRINRKISITDISEIPSLFCKLFPNYLSHLSNGSTIITPKESLLNFDIEPLSVKNKKLSEVMDMLAPALEKHKITFSTFHPRAQKKNILDRKIERLELPKMPAVEALTRIVQSLGPNVYWLLGGFDEERLLFISEVQ